jgi:4-amino-4-deoxy-L-arabinose transferase-like glycosyltransferase
MTPLKALVIFPEDKSTGARKPAERLVWALLGFMLLTFFLHPDWSAGRNHPDENYHLKVFIESLEGSILAPTLKGHPWFNKPPLLLWLAAVPHKLLGMGLRESLRLIAILGWMISFIHTAAILSLDTDRESKTLVPRAFAAIASFGVFWFSRIGMMDLPLLANLLAVTYSCWKWKTRGFARRELGFMSVALAVGGWWKGPVFYPWTFLACLLLFDRSEWRPALRALKTTFWIPLSALIIGNAWMLWLLAHHGEAYAKFFFLKENVSRLKAVRPALLMIYIILGTFPFWGMILRALFHAPKTINSPSTRIGLSLVLSTLVIFGMGADKHFHWFIALYTGLLLLPWPDRLQTRPMVHATSRALDVMAGAGILGIALLFAAFCHFSEVSLPLSGVLLLITAGILAFVSALRGYPSGLTAGWTAVFTLLLYWLVPYSIRPDQAPAAQAQGKLWNCEPISKGRVQSSDSDSLLFYKFRERFTNTDREVAALLRNPTRETTQALTDRLRVTVHCTKNPES